MCRVYWPYNFITIQMTHAQTKQFIKTTLYRRRHNETCIYYFQMYIIILNWVYLFSEKKFVEWN